MTARRALVVAAIVGAVAIAIAMYSCPGSSSRTADRHPATTRSAKRLVSHGAGDPTGTRVAGTVYRESAVAAGATVRLRTSVSYVEVAVAQTDAAGHFDLGTFAAAAYFIVAEAPNVTGATLRVDLRDPTARPAPDQLRLVMHDCNASIFGIVGDASGGPIAKARVSANVAGTESGTDGAFELCVPSGQSQVFARAEGYADVQLAVTASGRVHRDIELAPEAGVAGRVVRADNGQPVPDAVVVARPSDWARQRTKMTLRGTSDGDGSFRIKGVAPGRYTLTATAPGLTTIEPLPIVADVEAPADELEVRVAAARVYEGKVVDASSKAPIAGATLTILPESFDAGAGTTAVSGSDGSFVFDDLRPEPYKVFVQGYASRQASQQVSLVDADVRGATLEVKALASIAGRVTRNGQPVDGANVRADRVATTSDVDGAFVLRGLAAGTHSVYAESTRLGAFTNSSPITVADGEQKTGLAIELDLAASVSGVVVDQNDKPVAGVAVRFQLRGGRDVGQATTAEDGTFTAGAMSGGGEYAYMVTSADGSPISYPPAEGTFAPVELKDGSSKVTGLRVKIRYDRLAISGRVLKSNGEPAPDVTVAIARGMMPAFSTRRATTDTAGRFTLKDLPGGSYSVVATSLGGEQRVENIAAGMKGLEIRLPEVVTITGTLEGFSAPPSVNASALESSFPTSYRANVNGAVFTIKNVPVGEYEIRASSKDGYGTSRVVVAVGANPPVVIKNVGRGVIEGRVVDGTTHQPLAGFLCSTFDSRSNVTTTASGTFRLERVPVGRRWVFCESRDDQADARGEVEVAANNTAHVEMTAAKREPVKHAYTGLTLDDELDKVVVKAVAPGSPAERVAIKVGDHITKIMDMPLSGFGVGGRMARAFEYLPIDMPIELTLERDGKERTVELVAVAAP